MFEHVMRAGKPVQAPPCIMQFPDQVLARHLCVSYTFKRCASTFGDCFSYALAKASGAPLLFKGNDFSKTDVQQVVRTAE
jgi:hypothetical protein